MPSVEEARSFSLETKDYVTGASWLTLCVLMNFFHHCSDEGKERIFTIFAIIAPPPQIFSSGAILRHLLVFYVALYVSLQSIFPKLPKSNLVLIVKNYSNVSFPRLCSQGRSWQVGSKFLAKLTITVILFL